MRTTVRLNDALMNQAKREAARRKVTLTALIESGLRMALAAEAKLPRAHVDLPVSRETGGVRPGIDISNNAEVLDIMDGLFDPARRQRIG
jgi:hypothetical protein